MLKKKRFVDTKQGDYDDNSNLLFGVKTSVWGNQHIQCDLKVGHKVNIMDQLATSLKCNSLFWHQITRDKIARKPKKTKKRA